VCVSRWPYRVLVQSRVRECAKTQYGHPIESWHTHPIESWHTHVLSLSLSLYLSLSLSLFTHTHTHIHIHTHTHIPTHHTPNTHTHQGYYGVAMVSRIDKIVGRFCRTFSLLYDSFAKETYNLIDPNYQSHPIRQL